MRTTPDIVFSRQRVVVYVDGCFWHGCPIHATSPKANADYWKAKLIRNRERDADVNMALRAAGWTVIRVWEHEPVAAAAAVVVDAITNPPLRASRLETPLPTRAGRG
jgi:DNA mismatch endonuclease (patch repair protein)